MCLFKTFQVCIYISIIIKFKHPKDEKTKQSNYVPAYSGSSGNGTFQKTFQPQLSNIYHIVKPSVNGGTCINIIPFSYNEIIW